MGTPAAQPSSELANKAFFRFSIIKRMLRSTVSDGFRPRKPRATDYRYGIAAIRSLYSLARLLGSLAV